MEGTQYQILDRIDVGGMAEIFRAKNLNTNEIVAIKRILPELSRQADFVDMFVDEAAVCMLLDHPSIVRVYELGMMDNDLFLSMEYVEGLNLRELLNYACTTGTPIPMHESVLIAIHILDGLEYAHHCRDNEGEPLNLIHRDVSPPNILLGYNGDVKITDFGLVKAKTQMTHTVPGLIKGKFSYLSPEAAYGESLDLRTDIYAVGIILWELLACRPLFADPVEMKILDMVRRSIIPELSPLNPAVTPELEAIVQKGLARNRAERYQTAKEFAEALRAYYKSIGRPKSQLGQIVALAKPPVNHDEDEIPQRPPSVSQLIPLDAIEASIRREKEKAAEEARRSQLESLARKKEALEKAAEEQSKASKQAADVPPSPVDTPAKASAEAAPSPSVASPATEVRSSKRQAQAQESRMPLYIVIAVLFIFFLALIGYYAFG